MKEHLVGFESLPDEEDCFGEVLSVGDGAEAYDREVELRQTNRLPNRCRPNQSHSEKMNDEKLHEMMAAYADKKHIRSEYRDKTAEKIKAAKTHAEKMEIARKYHEALLIRDPYVFDKRTHARLLAQNRTALKFERVHE